MKGLMVIQGCLPAMFC